MTTAQSRRILRHQLVAVAEREVVVGLDVQPPEQVFLPRRQRRAADRLDVDQRHQAQHLQQLFGADQVRELRDDVRIVEIAAERDLRHRQVVADQELDRLPRFAGHLETIERGAGQPHAFLRVFAVGRLADVVEEQREA